MNLDEAIRHAEKKVAPQLKSQDLAALLSLIEIAKRVRRTQRPLRDLARALVPDESLNQIRMANLAEDGPEPEPPDSISS